MVWRGKNVPDTFFMCNIVSTTCYVECNVKSTRTKESSKQNCVTPCGDVCSVLLLCHNNCCYPNGQLSETYVAASIESLVALGSRAVVNVGSCMQRATFSCLRQCMYARGYFFTRNKVIILLINDSNKIF